MISSLQHFFTLSLPNIIVSGLICEWVALKVGYPKTCISSASPWTNCQIAIVVWQSIPILRKNIDHIKLVSYLPVSYPATSEQEGWLPRHDILSYKHIINHIQTIQMSYVNVFLFFLGGSLIINYIYIYIIIYIAFTAAFTIVQLFGIV